MTDAALGSPALPARLQRLREGSALPLAVVVTAIVVLWYLGAIWLNSGLVEQRLEHPSTREFIDAAWSLERPVLPAPHQVAIEFYQSVFEREIDSPRSLVVTVDVVTGTADAWLQHPLLTSADAGSPLPGINGLAVHAG